MSTQKKQAIAATLIAAAITIAAVLTGTDKPADGCQPCDCAGAVVALPGDATALAADASAVTAVAK
jgi:hypothetical protein